MWFCVWLKTPLSISAENPKTFYIDNAWSEYKAPLLNKCKDMIIAKMKEIIKIKLEIPDNLLKLPFSSILIITSSFCWLKISTIEITLLESTTDVKSLSSGGYQEHTIYFWNCYVLSGSRNRCWNTLPSHRDIFTCVKFGK